MFSKSVRRGRLSEDWHDDAVRLARVAGWRTTASSARGRRDSRPHAPSARRDSRTTCSNATAMSVASGTRHESGDADLRERALHLVAHAVRVRWFSDARRLSRLSHLETDSRLHPRVRGQVRSAQTHSLQHWRRERAARGERAVGDRALHRRGHSLRWCDRRRRTRLGSAVAKLSGQLRRTCVPLSRLSLGVRVRWEEGADRRRRKLGMRHRMRCGDAREPGVDQHATRLSLRSEAPVRPADGRVLPRRAAHPELARALAAGRAAARHRRRPASLRPPEAGSQAAGDAPDHELPAPAPSRARQCHAEAGHRRAARQERALRRWLRDRAGHHSCGPRATGQACRVSRPVGFTSRRAARTCTSTCSRASIPDSTSWDSSGPRARRIRS